MNVCTQLGMFPENLLDTNVSVELFNRVHFEYEFSSFQYGRQLASYVYNIQYHLIILTLLMRFFDYELTFDMCVLCLAENLTVIPAV